jgi:hypothetical protein
LTASELGWNHDRTRPLYRDECGLLFLYRKSDDEDMNNSYILTREQGHRLRALKKRE